MRKKHILLPLTLACVSFLFSGCSSASESTSAPEQDLPVIVVGCDDYTPFSYLDTNGELTGIDVDLAKEAFGRMGYKPEFTVINWENKKELLSSGEIDCIWSCFTIDGREDEYNWAGPYMRSEHVIAVNEDSDIFTLQDLEGKLIAVQSSTKPEDILREHRSDLSQFRKVISVKKRDLIFTMLAKGYVDAAAAHITAVEQFMNDCEIKFRILDEPLLAVGIGAAFDIGNNSGINTELDAVFDDMLNDGTTEQIISRYLSDPKQYLYTASETAQTSEVNDEE